METTVVGLYGDYTDGSPDSEELCKTRFGNEGRCPHLSIPFPFFVTGEAIVLRRILGDVFKIKRNRLQTT